MSWFRHHFHCIACEGDWLCEDCVADVGDCPFCGARDAFPYKSDDWSVIVEPAGDAFVVLECSEVNAQGPDYRPLGRFASRDAANAFLAARR